MSRQIMLDLRLLTILDFNLSTMSDFKKFILHCPKSYFFCRWGGTLNVPFFGYIIAS